MWLASVHLLAWGQVVALRALIRFIALTMLALTGPVAGLRTGNGPGIQACACGCVVDFESECGCGSSPSMPASSGHRTPSPCQQPPVPSSPSMATAGLAETEKGQEEGFKKKTEPRPWIPSVEDRGTTLVHRIKADLAAGLDGVGPPEKCMERLARLSTFRI